MTKPSSWLLCSNVNATINSAVNAGTPLNYWNAPDETLNEPVEYLIVIDTTTNLNVSEDRSTESSKDKVLLFKDATTNRNVEEDWSMKIKVMSKSDRLWQEWWIEHNESNLRSTLLMWGCHESINWDFTLLISIWHCHESIDILLKTDATTNLNVAEDLTCLIWFVERYAIGSLWIVEWVAIGSLFVFFDFTLLISSWHCHKRSALPQVVCQMVGSLQIFDQMKVMTPIYLTQNFLNELIVDNRVSFHLWR